MLLSQTNISQIQRANPLDLENRNAQTFQSIMDEVQSHRSWIGLTLKTVRYDKWVVLTPGKHGEVKYTVFDQTGILARGNKYGHYRKLLLELLDSGFVQVVPRGTFDEISRGW